MPRRREAPAGTAMAAADPFRDLPPLLSVEAASRLLGWSASKGWRLAQRGQFPAATRVGARYYVRTRLLARWLAGAAEPTDAATEADDAGPGGLRLVAGGEGGGG